MKTNIGFCVKNSLLKVMEILQTNLESRACYFNIFCKIVLVHDIRSSESQSNVAWFMHKLCKHAFLYRDKF